MSAFPPFCAVDAEGCACPKCGHVPVQVREHSHYTDGDSVEGYCSECETMLELLAHVEIKFSDPELAT